MSEDQVPSLHGQEIERVRDIIFGTQMNDYEQRFQRLSRDFARLEQDIERLTEQLIEQNSTQSKNLQTLRKEMRQTDDDIRDELRETAKTLLAAKVDRAVLGELFIEMGTNLKTGQGLAEVLKQLQSGG